MTDRELLESAAKAVDLVHCEYGELSGGAPVLYVPGIGVWDPLGDDGDALRLAVKLEMNIHCDGDMTWASEGVTRISYHAETYGVDHCAATRRAIVRAAAAIGGAA